MADTISAREINKHIAEFMGWSELEWRDEGSDGTWKWPAGWYGNHPLGRPGYLTADYAHSVDDLAPVIEKLRANDRYLNVSIVGSKSYAADLYDKCDGWLSEATAEGMAMAVCLTIISYLEEASGSK